MDNVIRGYELKGLLGEGGFGAVYRAYQPAIKRDVALKIILPEFANHPEFIRRFEAEAQIVARLEHLHIVPLYDFWRDPDGAYLVMRLLKGGSLRKLISKGPLSLPETVRILDQVAAALATAHRNGVIHRDIKPDNILLDEEENAYLTDFGIAKNLLDDSADDDEDELTGSPHYISPEQAQQEPVSPQSDIYSLGIVVFEMLTGTAPFAGNTTMMEVILKQINEPLPPLPSVNPDVPSAIDAIIQRATDKDPAIRYPDVLSFALAFREAVPGLAPVPTKRAQADDTLEIEIDGVETIKLKSLIEPSIDNPYKGLRPFEEADAGDFYGRSSLVGRLLDHVKDHRFMAVIGPSGSGKSSVVKAGLLPTLRKETKWFICEMVPGVNPFQELESALLSVASGRHPNLLQKLQLNENGLFESVGRILPHDESQLLLVIDQFEEVFTQTEDEATRASFLNCLLVATTNLDSRLRVVITMRADFFDRPLQYPGFGELIRTRSEVVLPLSREEMQEAIIAPATRAGLSVESALVSAIITEVSEQPGALPLLQYALTEVFERRKGKTLTFTAYQESGGVLGALARRAEDLYIQLGSDEQELVRQIFLRLVTLGEGTEDTRRRVLQANLLSIGDEKANSVLDLYSRYRLLTFDNDPVTRDPTVEVAHEALIRQWQRLRDWLDDNRDDVRVQQRLALATQEWLRSGRDTSFLASGTRLQQFQTLLEAGNLTLSDEEKSYTHASIAERDRLIAEEEARRAREAALERRARRILSALVGVFVVAAIIALVLAVLALTARSEAVEARDAAERNEATAIAESYLRATAEYQAVDQRNLALTDASRLLSIIALEQLKQDPVASLLLALRALPSDDNPRPYTPQAEFALTQAIQASLERTYINPFGSTSIGVVAYNNHQLAITGQGLLVVDPTFDTRIELEGHSGTVLNAEWLSDGDLMSYDNQQVIIWHGQSSQYTLNSDEPLTCAASNGTLVALCSGTTVRVWHPSANSTTQLRPFETHVQGAAWSPNGQWVAAWNETTLLVWNPATEETLTLQPADSGHSITGVVWSPTSSGLALIVSDFSARYWNLIDDPIRLEGHTKTIDGILFVDGQRLITWGDDGLARVWSIDGDTIATMGDAISEINGMALAPNGTVVLLWQNNGSAALWDSESGNRLTQLQGQDANILNAAWLNDDTFATTDVSFAIRIWNASDGSLATSLYGHTNRVKGLIWQNERYLLSFSQDGSVRQWEVFSENGLPLGSGLLYDYGGPRGFLDYARWLDATTIITAGQDGIPRRWDLATGEVQELPNPERLRWRVVWSPDGSKVLTYVDNGAGQVWDFATHTELFTIPEPLKANSAFWIGAGLFVSYDNGDIVWHDATTGQVLGTLKGHTKQLNDLTYHLERRVLATAGADNTIRLWSLPATPQGQDLTPRVTIDTEQRQPLHLTWNTDGNQLLSGGFNGDVSIWNAQDGQRLLFLTGNREFPVRDKVRYSPDERYIAAAIEDEIFVWDTIGNLVFRVNEIGGTQGVAWTTQNNRLRLLTWGHSGLIRLWDMPEGVEVLRHQDSNVVLAAAFNSEGTQILSVGRNGRLRVWQAWPDLETLIAQTQTCCLTRQLSPAQRNRFNIIQARNE